MTQILNDLRIGEETKLSERFMGKQIYAKLINFGAMPAAGEEKAVAHGITGMDQFGIDYGRSYVEQGNGNRHALTYPNAVPNGFWRAKVNETEVSIQSGQDRSTFTAVICVWHTKAGELPGIEPDTAAEIATLKAQFNALQVQGKAAYELCEFYFFRHPTLRPGFQLAHGGLIANAATLYPESWAYLQTAEGQKLCKTEAEWQAMTMATWATLADGTKIGWNGIGGVPFYAPDTATGALRLPDLRGMYMEGAGFDSLSVGDVHGDGVRRQISDLYPVAQNTSSYSYSGSSGAFHYSAAKTLNVFQVSGSSKRTTYGITHDNSRVVPVANQFQPRAWGSLACVYLGLPASVCQLAEAY